MNWLPKYLEYSDEYAGVIAGNSAMRLIVSARGGSYRLQSPEPRCGWLTFRGFPVASLVRSYVSVVVYDPAPEILDALSTLPDDPRDHPFVPFKESAM